MRAQDLQRKHDVYELSNEKCMVKCAVKKNGSIISMVVNENFISFVTFLRTALNHFIKREKKLKYFEIVHKNVLAQTHTQSFYFASCAAPTGNGA